MFRSFPVEHETGPRFPSSTVSLGDIPSSKNQPCPYSLELSQSVRLNQLKRRPLSCLIACLFVCLFEASLCCRLIVGAERDALSGRLGKTVTLF